MSAMTMTNIKRWKSHKVHSTHARSSCREAYDSSQRDYEQPIHFKNVIPDNYDRNDNKDK